MSFSEGLGRTIEWYRMHMLNSIKHLDRSYSTSSPSNLALTTRHLRSSQTNQFPTPSCLQLPTSFREVHILSGKLPFSISTKAYLKGDAAIPIWLHDCSKGA